MSLEHRRADDHSPLEKTDETDAELVQLSQDVESDAEIAMLVEDTTLRDVLDTSVEFCTTLVAALLDDDIHGNRILADLKETARAGVITTSHCSGVGTAEVASTNIMEDLATILNVPGGAVLHHSVCD